MKAKLIGWAVAVLLAGCALPVKDAGDGVYYAESPPDYVHVDVGGSNWGWLGIPYPYAPFYVSHWDWLGNRWYYPPFGMPYHPATSPYRSHPPLVYAPPRVADGRTAYRERSNLRNDRARTARITRNSGAQRPERAVAGPDRARVRPAASASTMRSTSAPRSRPPRASRPASSPRPAARPRPSRDID